MSATRKGVQLCGLLDASCDRNGDKPAIGNDERQYTFLQLRQLSDQLATAFVRAGLRGERIATLLPNSVELIACYFGCWRAGAIVVPFEYVDAPPEIRYGLRDSGARWLIVHEEKLADLAQVDLSQTAVDSVFVVGAASSGYRNFDELAVAAADPLPEVPPETPAFILYTSGSTALPKGVVHSHASAEGIIESVLSALDKVNGDSRMVIHDSISHMGGWIEAFDVARFYTGLRRWRPTIVGAHVDHLWQMVRHPDARRADFESVSTVFTGGDELPISLQRAFIELTGKLIQVGWGMTEAIWLTIARQPELRRRGFMGTPVEGVRIQITDSSGRAVADGTAGELWIKGPMVSPGYWRRPEADRDVFVDGWLRTGDMGLRDDAGNYWFTGRLKQLIERNSENITPGEIEQAIYRHPAIAEAAAFGVVDVNEGQVPIAYVAFKPGCEATETELKEFLATQIAAFKIPLRILAIDALPLTHSGKIDHKALAERYQRQSAG